MVSSTREQRYLRQTLKTPNIVVRFSHNARHKQAVSLVADNAPQGGSVLDFGCHYGGFLGQVAERRADLTLYGHDIRPLEEPRNHFTFLPDLNTLTDLQFDVITCLEVLEHMFDDERTAFFSYIGRMVKPGGRLVISVPIIGGPVLLLKELNKTLLYGKERKITYSLGELLRATFLGVPAPRPPGIRDTHKGFNFREIEQRMRRTMPATETFYCPFKSLPWFVNSQAFFVAKL